MKMDKRLPLVLLIPLLLATSAAAQVNPVICSITTETVAAIPTNRARRTIGVGEEVRLTAEPQGLSPITWSLSGQGSLSATSGGSVTFTAHDRASSPTISARYKGKSVSVSFSVLEPTHESAVKVTDLHYPPGTFGAGMVLDITVHPNNVSFAKVQCREVSGPASAITGYFTNFHPHVLRHVVSTSWVSLHANNTWADEAAHSGTPPPWSAGSYQWVIPVQWCVIGSTNVGTLPGRVQVFTITDNSGNSTISKLGQTVQRAP